MKYFTKYIVVFLVCFLSLNELFSCTYTINPPTVIQPTCGDNGSISISTTPSLGSNAKYYVYKNGSYLVKLTGAIANLNSLSPGTYKVIVEDNLTGCKDSVDNIIIYPVTNNLQVTYQVTDTPKCDTTKYDKPGRIVLYYTNASPPVSVNWSFSATLHDSIAENLTKGYYSAVVVDKNNCKFKLDSMYVPSKQSPIKLKTTNVIASTCDSPNGEIYLYFEGGTPPYRYQWQVKDTFNWDVMPLDSLGGGTYVCDVSDKLMCEVYSFPIKLPSFPGPKVKIIGTDSICANEGFGSLSAVLTQGDDLQTGFEWFKSDLPFSTSKDIGSLDSGLYKVIATDNAKCKDSSTHRIYRYPEKKIRLIPDKYQIVKNQKTFIRIDSPKGLYNLVWTPTKNVDILQDSNVWVYPDSSTYYLLEANYGPGCITRAIQYIEVVTPIDSLIFPNLFTPNGDNLNDKYYLRGEINNNDNFEFKVYDRWGNNVFNAYTSNFQWDGTDEKGKPLNYGVYTYLVKYTIAYPQKKEIIQSGQIMLER